MVYRVMITKVARKQIARLPKRTAARVLDAVAGLAHDPRPTGVEKLVGQDRYRIRIGDYRVLYLVTDAELVVTVVQAGHRRQIYRK